MNRLRLDGAEITPSKIVCIGRNYLEHVRELGNESPEAMIVFAKPNSAISSTLYSEIDGEPLHYEGEICFAVRDSRFFGVGFGLDLTRRELQKKLKNKGLPWERAKAFDGSACFSDFVAIGDCDLGTLSLRLVVDDRRRQQGGTELMTYKPDAILAGVLDFMSLEDGDIVMTGSPKGVGEVLAGELFCGSIFAGDTELVSAQWQAD